MHLGEFFCKCLSWHTYNKSCRYRLLIFHCQDVLHGQVFNLQHILLQVIPLRFLWSAVKIVLAITGLQKTISIYSLHLLYLFHKPFWAGCKVDHLLLELQYTCPLSRRRQILLLLKFKLLAEHIFYMSPRWWLQEYCSCIPGVVFWSLGSSSRYRLFFFKPAKKRYCK